MGVPCTEKNFDEKAFRKTLSKLWDPKVGVNIRCISPFNCFIFTYFHPKDYERVWQGSPWNLNNKLLALAPRKPNEDLDLLEINKVPMWIQAFGVPIGFMSMQVCEAIGKFAGELIDEDNNKF